MANLSKTTQDHEEIRSWAEARGGKPSSVKNTGSEGDIGILRIDFPGFSGEGSLEHISWDEFFEKFDQQNLALLYQEETAGGQKSNFNKLVSAETAAANEERSGGGKGGKRAGVKKGAGKKTAAKKAVAKKTVAKKTVAKKATAKKAVKKAAGKKAPNKKATGSKRATKKATGKKQGRR